MTTLENSVENEGECQAHNITSDYGRHMQKTELQPRYTNTHNGKLKDAVTPITK